MTYTPTTAVVRGQYELAGNPEAFDRWLAEQLRKAARTERERIAHLAESIRSAHDIAECAAPVEGETGRQECIDQWISICEEPEAWLRDLADDPEWLEAEFIAHARTDVPALVAEVERLQDIVDRVWDEHSPEVTEYGTYCVTCSEDYGLIVGAYPCPPIHALEES